MRPPVHAVSSHSSASFSHAVMQPDIIFMTYNYARGKPIAVGAGIKTQTLLTIASMYFA